MRRAWTVVGVVLVLYGAVSVAVPRLLGGAAGAWAGGAFGLLAVVSLVAAIALGSRGELVSVTLRGDRLVVRPRGANVIWAMHGEIDVPQSKVVDVRVADRKSLPIGLRIPGTSIPGVLTAGSYGTGRSRAFWLVRKARDVLVVDLRDHTYARIVVEVERPTEMADRFRSWMNLPAHQRPAT